MSKLQQQSQMPPSTFAKQASTTTITSTLLKPNVSAKINPITPPLVRGPPASVPTTVTAQAVEAATTPVATTTTDVLPEIKTKNASENSKEPAPAGVDDVVVPRTSKRSKVPIKYFKESIPKHKGGLPSSARKATNGISASAPAAATSPPLLPSNPTELLLFYQARFQFEYAQIRQKLAVFDEKANDTLTKQLDGVGDRPAQVHLSKTFPQTSFPPCWSICVLSKKWIAKPSKTVDVEFCRSDPENLTFQFKILNLQRKGKDDLEVFNSSSCSGVEGLILQQQEQKQQQPTEEVKETSIPMVEEEKEEKKKSAGQKRRRRTGTTTRKRGRKRFQLNLKKVPKASTTTTTKEVELVLHFTMMWNQTTDLVLRSCKKPGLPEVLISVKNGIEGIRHLKLPTQLQEHYNSLALRCFGTEKQKPQEPEQHVSSSSTSK